MTAFTRLRGALLLLVLVAAAVAVGVVAAAELARSSARGSRSYITSSAAPAPSSTPMTVPARQRPPELSSTPAPTDTSANERLSVASASLYRSPAAIESLSLKSAFASSFSRFAFASSSLSPARASSVSKRSRRVAVSAGTVASAAGTPLDASKITSSVPSPFTSQIIARRVPAPKGTRTVFPMTRNGCAASRAASASASTAASRDSCASAVSRSSAADQSPASTRCFSASIRASQSATESIGDALGGAGGRDSAIQEVGSATSAAGSIRFLLHTAAPVHAPRSNLHVRRITLAAELLRPRPPLRAQLAAFAFLKCETSETHTVAVVATAGTVLR